MTTQNKVNAQHSHAHLYSEAIAMAQLVPLRRIAVRLVLNARQQREADRDNCSSCPHDHGDCRRHQ